MLMLNDNFRNYFLIGTFNSLIYLNALAYEYLC